MKSKGRKGDDGADEARCASRETSGLDSPTHTTVARCVGTRKGFLIREASKGSEKDFERKSKSHSADDDDAAAHGAR